jgi:hypothetical protein
MNKAIEHEIAGVDDSNKSHQNNNHKHHCNQQLNQKYINNVNPKFDP